MVATRVVGVDRAWGCGVRARHVGNARLRDAGRDACCCCGFGGEMDATGLTRGIGTRTVTALVTRQAGGVVKVVARGALCIEYRSRTAKVR